MWYTLQDFFENTIQNEYANSLYFRAEKGYKVGNIYEVFKGGEFSTDTYFNSFPLKFWLDKTRVKKFGLHFIGNGNGLIRIYGKGLNSETILLEEYFSDDVDKVFWLDTHSIDDKNVIYIYAKVISFSDVIVQKLEWVTDGKPLRDFRLAIVCTTFNRPEDVKRLVKRLSGVDYLVNKAHLYIINNGDPVDVQDDEFCSVIKNKNTGGTGGFMRGLLEAKESNKFDHVMFIDDDAFCDPLSIKKAITVLEYDESPEATIGGAMLYLDRPWVQYEAGATLKEFNIVSNNGNLNLLAPRSLMLNSLSSECSYGPWWFFIFPLKKGLKMSFPFFVRGDDVTFSLRNNFHPYILNGVCSWQESFDAKISPTVEYLAFRSFVMISLLYLHNKVNNFTLFKSIFSHIMRECCGYRYQIARALCIALEDIKSGPKFWIENIEMGKHLGFVSKQAGAIQHYEQVTRPDIPGEPFVPKMKKVVIAATLFGNLLPSRGSVCVEGLGPRPYMAVGKKQIVHYSPENKMSYVFPRNVSSFFKLVFHSFFLTLSLISSRDKLTKEYEQALNLFESENFWRGILK